MSDEQRLEERLRAFGTGLDDGADWEDVLKRSAGRLRVRPSRRKLTLAFATVVVVAASVTGVLVTRGTRPGVTGCSSALTWSCPAPSGPTGPGGATAPVGPLGVLDVTQMWGDYARQITIGELRAEAPWIPLPNSGVANDSNVELVRVWDHTSDPRQPVGHVAAAISYRSGVVLVWTGTGLDAMSFPPPTMQTISGVRAVVRTFGVGPTGAEGSHPQLTELLLPCGPNATLTLAGTMPQSDIVDVAQTLSPSPGDVSPAGDLPPANPQAGPYLTFWDTFLTDGTSVPSVDDAAGSLAFLPVAPSSLGNPSAIRETNPAQAPASDRVLSVRYDRASGWPYWLLERPSGSTTTSLLGDIAAKCTRASGCKEMTAEMIDLGGGVLALRLEDGVINRIVWVEGGVYYEVIGGASTFTSSDALAAAKNVAAAADS